MASEKYPRTAAWPERLWRIHESMENDKLRALRIMPESGTQAGEFPVAERTQVIELNSAYGVSELRDIVELTGSGSTSNANGLINLSTGTTTGSTATVGSAEIGRYSPGYSAEFHVGLEIPAELTGDQSIRWGGQGEAEENTICFGYDASGMYVSVTKAGTETMRTYQSDWNIDPLDGTGQSGYTLNPLRGNVYQVRFTWCGCGQVLFGIVGVIEDNHGIKTQKFIECHSHSDDEGLIVESPNMRVCVKADNGSTTGNVQASISSRQYSIVGKYVPKYRFSHDYRAAVTTNTTVKPLISFRRKSGYGNRSIKIEGYETIVSSEPHILEIRLESTLTGASFGTPTNHTTSETALDSDTSATALTGGVVVWQELVQSGTNLNKAGLASQQVDFDIPNGLTVTLCARTLSGTGSVISGFRMREEW